MLYFIYVLEKFFITIAKSVESRKPVFVIIFKIIYANKFHKNRPIII